MQTPIVFTGSDFAYDKNAHIVEDIDEISSLPRKFIIDPRNGRDQRVSRFKP